MIPERYRLCSYIGYLSGYRPVSVTRTGRCSPSEKDAPRPRRPRGNSCPRGGSACLPRGRERPQAPDRGGRLRRAGDGVPDRREGRAAAVPPRRDRPFGDPPPEPRRRTRFGRDVARRGEASPSPPPGGGGHGDSPREAGDPYREGGGRQVQLRDRPPGSETAFEGGRGPVRLPVRGAGRRPERPRRLRGPEDRSEDRDFRDR